MPIEDIISIVGIIGVIVGFLLFAGGTALLVISIIKTIKGKRRIGGIVGGGIMLFGSILLVFYFGMFALTSAMLNSMPYAKPLEYYNSSIFSSLYAKNSDQLAYLFAKESYSGDALEKEDAATIFGYIEGDVKSINSEALEVPYKSDIYASYCKYNIITEDSEKYVIYIYYFYGCDNDDYLGIQYIKIYEGNELLEEFGTIPDLD